MTAELDSIDDRSYEVGSSFEVFYLQQRRSLIALAYALTGSRTAAEDLAQEALVATFQDWNEIRSRDNPGTWVRRILLNTASSAFRRKRAELRALTKVPRSERMLFPEVTGEVEHMWAEVRRLPRRQTEVIALMYLEGYNQTEVASTLGISKESVNTHLRRARDTLTRRLHLEEYR